MSGFGTHGESTRFVALIGDVIASRRVPERQALQDTLHDAVAGRNEELGAGLAAALALTAGDEVQGLFAEPAGIPGTLAALAEAVHPQRLTFGLGQGGVSTRVRADVALMDGPCFHRARHALAAARKVDGWAAAAGFGDPWDEVLTALLRLQGEIRGEWTEVQNRYVAAARGRQQKEVAERFGVSPSTVSESLKAAHFAAILEAESATTALLSRLAHGDPKDEVGEEVGTP